MARRVCQRRGVCQEALDSSRSAVAPPRRQTISQTYTGVRRFKPCIDVSYCAPYFVSSMSGLRAIGALRSLMLISTIAKSRWRAGASLDEDLGLTHTMDDILREIDEVESQAVSHAKWSPWLLPEVPALLLAGTPAISEALPYFSGSSSALSAGGLGESASIAHHANSGPIRTTPSTCTFPRHSGN